MKISNKKVKQSRFESFKEGLETDPPETREDKFANYGFYTAYYVMGYLTVDELAEIQKVIGLSDEEVDNLTI